MDYPKLLNKKSLLIAGEPFHIDLEQQCLVQTGKAANIIPVDELKDEGDHYTVLLQRESKLPVKDLVTPSDELQVLRVILPKEIFSDGFWQDAAAIHQINSVSSQLGNPVLVVDEMLRQRLTGKLPKISSAGRQRKRPKF